MVSTVFKNNVHEGKFSELKIQHFIQCCPPQTTRPTTPHNDFKDRRRPSSPCPCTPAPKPPPGSPSPPGWSRSKPPSPRGRGSRPWKQRFRTISKGYCGGGGSIFSFFLLVCPSDLLQVAVLVVAGVAGLLKGQLGKEEEEENGD